jgi:hypothetical protein
VAGQVDAISQQEQPQPQQPSDSELCTTPIEDDRQPDELSTDSTLYAKSPIAYSRMDDAKMSDAGTSSTAVQAVLFSAGGVPSTNLNVVGAIDSEVVVDITSTFSMTLRPVWRTPSASTTSNVASHDSDIPHTSAPHPTMTMATPVTKAPAEIECPQTRSGASNLRRQAYDDPLGDSAGPPGPPSPPPSPTPPQLPPDVPPPPYTSCTSSSLTSTSNPQTTGMSNPALLDVKPYNPPGSEWIHCVVITTLVVVYCSYRMYRMLRNARSSLPKSSESEPCDHTDRPAAFSGPGRTWGSTGKHSRSREWLRKKRLRAERRLRDAVIHYAQFIALAKRTKRAIEDSRIRV